MAVCLSRKGRSAVLGTSSKVCAKTAVPSDGLKKDFQKSKISFWPKMIAHSDDCSSARMSKSSLSFCIFSQSSFSFHTKQWLKRYKHLRGTVVGAWQLYSQLNTLVLNLQFYLQLTVLEEMFSGHTHQIYKARILRPKKNNQ